MKKSNAILVVTAIIIMILSIFAVGIIYSVYKDIVGEKVKNEWEELINRKENTVIYFGKKDCPWCVKYKPVLQALKEKYNVSYEYIDTDIVNGFEELLLKLNTNYETFSTPYTVIVKKGKKQAELFGYQTPKAVFDFYQAYGLVDKNEKYEEIVIDESKIIINANKEEYPHLNFLNYVDYIAMLKNKSKNILVIGQTTCGYCIQYKPILNEIAKENNIVINYIDIDVLTQKEYADFIESLDYFKKNENWGTPLTLIVENKSVVDYSEGIKNKSNTINYYKDLGIIK